jgi:hypothetical protein
MLALALAQPPAFIGTVPQPNAALDAAHDCLRAGIEARLSDNPPAPLDGERWEWALAIADKCEAELNGAADSKEAETLYSDASHSGITKRQLLRSEALYFVDRLIRDHYESQR